MHQAGLGVTLVMLRVLHVRNVKCARVPVPVIMIMSYVQTHGETGCVTVPKCDVV